MTGITALWTDFATLEPRGGPPSPTGTNAYRTGRPDRPPGAIVRLLRRPLRGSPVAAPGGSLHEVEQPRPRGLVLLPVDVEGAVAAQVDVVADVLRAQDVLRPVAGYL